MYALVFFLALAGSVFSLVIPRQDAPSGWLTDILQPYKDYHARYEALDCAVKHNTTFFDQCCHPLLKNEPISALPPQCNPANLPTTSSDAADPDCTDDGDDNDQPTTTAESDDPDCTDDGHDGQVDSTSSQEPTSTFEPTSTTTTQSTSTTLEPTSTSTTESTSKPTSTSKSTSSSTSTHSSSAKPTNTPAANVGSAPSSSSQVFSDGVATFFFQNGVAGACGQVHSDQDVIAAIDADRYGDTSEVSPLCGQQVHITNKNNGKSVVATIRDACPTCRNRNSIDLSVGAFTQIATEEEGEVPIEWFFL